MNDKVVNKILKAPLDAGVYKFYDKSQKVIYVGKAKKLKNRLRSYLSYKTSTNARLKSLYKNINDLEYIVRANEYEALILEAELIKQFTPKYNVLLKDDKTYPYIKIDLNKPWPYLELARKVSNDGALYFGPFPEVHIIRSVLRTLNKVFPLVKCRRSRFNNKAPCLNYQIKRCLAPCVNLVDKKTYSKVVSSVVAVLKGNKTEIIQELEKAMWGYSDAQNFEQAIELRDKIASLQKFLNSQAVISSDIANFDFLYYSDTVLVLAFIRNGVLLGQKALLEWTKNDSITALLVNYYNKSNDKKKLLVYDKVNLDDFAILSKINIEVDYAGKYLSKVELNKLLDILKARILEIKSRLEKANNEKNLFKSWIEKHCKLSLGEEFVVEVYDMSHLSGTEPVGAKVSFQALEKNKKAYRYYKIKDTRLAGDDYGMMAEVLTRRLKSKTDKLPDVILIDGGRGQISKVAPLIKGLGVALLSIAKDKTRAKALSKDKIYVYTERLHGPFVPEDKVLQVFKRMRDEAHRFVVGFERKRQKKINFSK